MKHPNLHKMNLLSLVLVSSAFVTTVRNLTAIAETQMQMLFFGLFAALFFFVPVALVSAELATGWPRSGGVYIWVKEALGERAAFVALWMQWSYAILGTISTLYFASDAIIFVFDPHLANNPVALITLSTAIIWCFTLLSLHGQKTSSLISSFCFATGVLIPATFIIFLGILYLALGNTPQLNLSLSWENLVPDFSKVTTLVLLVGFIRGFAGVEAGASHANEVVNPRKNYPIAIFFVVLFGLTINVLGSMSVAVVIPQDKLSLTAGLIDAFHRFLAVFHLESLSRFMAFLIAIGAIGTVNTWLMGPVKGLLAAAENGDLHPVLKKTTAKGSPTYLLLIQAVVLTAAVIVLLLLPTLNIAFWISVALSIIVYSVMYLLMLISAIVLRYKEPNTPRKYRVPGGLAGMWFTALVGIATLCFTLAISFLPPAELPPEMHGTYSTIMLISGVSLVSLPLIIFLFRQTSWKN